MIESETDTYLRLLSDPLNRQIVRYLREGNEDLTTIDDLVDQLLTDDDSPTTENVASRRQLAPELHHRHLPKLAASDVLEFEPEDGTVTYLNPGGIEPVLESLPREVTVQDS
jgi:hypothetical protein